jgi:hypothetical protein
VVNKVALGQVFVCFPVNVEFVVDKVALGQIFLSVFWFSPVGVIPSMPHIDSSPTV